MVMEKFLLLLKWLPDLSDSFVIIVLGAKSFFSEGNSSLLLGRRKQPNHENAIKNFTKGKK